MSAEKQKIMLPAILLANDLRSGAVVFRSATGWSLNPADALVAEDVAEAQALQQSAALAVSANEVVDAALVDVTVRRDGVPIPNHFRERFKIAGPSIRRDLGKQAEFVAVAES